MVDSLVQKLGFDAGDTLSTLATLEAGFNKFNAALNSAAAAVKTFNAASGGTSGAAQALKQTNAAASEAARIFEQTRTPLERYQATLAKLGGLAQQGAISQDTHARAVQQAGTALEAAGKSGKNMWVTWETLGRVLQTQMIVRGLNAVRDAVEFAVTSFLKFSKTISEIKAINPERTFKEITANVQQMSDAFNQPISVVAEAQYQVLSDQFTSAADRANILTAANQLAKTTEDDLVGATQLLTGALNAYGESSDMAGLRAAQFFEAINLGRFRASELGTALGRVQTIGHELGVSMEELQASLITITIGGVKASEGATQLRGILTALLKPSEGMKKALADIGVESGEAAIRTWDLQGALEAVKGSTDGSSAALGRLFPNIRGAAGALRLLSEGAETHKKAMESLRKIDQSIIAGKALEAMSTDAARLTAELNKLRNFFTVELGADIVAKLNTLVNLFGGGKGLVGALRLVTSETPKAMVMILGLYMATARFGAAGDAAFAKWTGGWDGFGRGIALGLKQLATLRGALTLLAVYEIGTMLGQQIGSKFGEMIAAPHVAQRKALADFIEMNKQRTEAAIREKDRENNELEKRLRQYLTGAYKVYLQDAANFDKSMKLHEQSAKRAFDNILGTYRKLTQELFSAAEASAKKAAEAPQKAAEIRQGVADLQFNAQVAQWGERTDFQYSKFAERARQLGAAAAQLQASAKDENQERIAEATWQRANAYKQMAMSAAQQSGNMVLQNRALELSISLENSRADAVERNGKLQAQLTKEQETRGRQAEIHLEELTRGRDELEKKLSTWTKGEKGELILKSPEQAKRDLAEYDTMFQTWVNNVNKYAKGDFLKNFMGDARAFESLKREAERMLAGVYLKDLQIAPEAIARMWDNLQASAARLRLEFPALVKIEAFTGKNVITDGLDAVLTEYGKKASDMMSREMKRAAASKDMEAARQSFDKARQGFTLPLERGSTGRGLERMGVLSPLNPALIAGAVRQMELLGRKTEITTEEWINLNETINSSAFKTAISQLSVVSQERLSGMVDAIKRIKTAQDQAKAAGLVDPKAKAEADAIQEQINKLPVKIQLENSAADQMEREQNAAKDTTTEIGNQTTSINSVLPSVTSLEEAWWRVEAAARAASQAASGAGIATVGGAGGFDFSGPETTIAALGGLIRYFDRGGSARGTDRIPAMLSPGEFVMSPRAAKRWYSQLVAMNAGIQPAYRSQGGDTSISVGDINVNGASQPRETAREVIKSLKRELRRGTSMLN